MIEEGTVISATGEHTPAGCRIEGHCAYDGRDHSIAPCEVEGHFNCDGNTHGENCYIAEL